MGNIFDFTPIAWRLVTQSCIDFGVKQRKVEVSSKFINDSRSGISHSNRRHHEGRRALEEFQECHNLARRSLEIADQPKDTTRQEVSLSRNIDFFLHHLY